MADQNSRQPPLIEVERPAVEHVLDAETKQEDGDSSFVIIQPSVGDELGAVTSRIIRKGLKLRCLELRLQRDSIPFAFFRYGLFPFMEKCVSVDWTIITAEDIEGRHIRCHQLQVNDRLKEVLFNFKEAQAVAVILINTQEDYSIAPHNLEEMQRNNLPVLILTREEGNKLLKTLNTYGEETLLARFEAESEVNRSVHVANIHPAANYSRHSPSMFRKKVDKDDLKSKVKKVMFTSDKKPVAICRDQSTFKEIMSIFSNYERQAKADNSLHPEFREALKKIRKHFEKMFMEDLALYILLTYRIDFNTSVYICEDKKTFIKECWTRIECMESKELATSISAFLERGDFHVMFCSGVRKGFQEESVFSLLMKACFQLSKVSVHLHETITTEMRDFCSKSCYARMMWITLCSRLYQQRRYMHGIDTTGMPLTGIWYKHFITPYYPRITMTDKVVEDIAKGLELSRLLHLSEDLSFDCTCVHQLMVSNGNLRSFKELRKYICAIEDFINDAETLLSLFTNIRVSYIGDVARTFRANITEEELEEAITEGIRFVNTVSSLCDHPRIKSEACNLECTKLLKVILDMMVDITSSRSDVYLAKFITNGRLMEKYRDTVHDYIIESARMNFRKMTIQHFNQLYKSIPIWTNKFVEEYLKRCTLPSSVKISDYPWNEFISEVVKRIPGAHEHCYLVDLIFVRIAKVYEADNRAKSFVLDLFELTEPRLLAVGDVSQDRDQKVRTRAAAQFKKYIQENGIQRILLEPMMAIMDNISEGRNEFQVLILEVIYRVIIPDVKVLKGILDASVYHLLKDQTWLQQLSTKQTFYWGLVTSCCSQVKVVADHIDWMSKYRYLITQVSKIFTRCLDHKEKSEDWNTSLLSEDIKKYLSWIHSIEDVLQVWFDKFTNMNINYDDIFMYVYHSDCLKEVCEAVGKKALFVDDHQLQVLQKTFRSKFESLNCHLLLYVSQLSDDKWCTLPSLLSEYGVALPKGLHSRIQKHVVFPKDYNTDRENVLSHPLPANTTGKFQPGKGITLELTKQCSLQELSDLDQCLDEFQKPLVSQLDMLKFFKLNRNVMFDKYLRLKIRQVLQEETVIEFAESAAKLYTPVSSSLQPVLQKKQPSIGISVMVLCKALVCTQELLQKIMNGEAVYSEIIAEGEVDLEQIDVVHEFDILKLYFSTFRPHDFQVNFEGLFGLKSLLELFQYTKHVHTIHSVCEQYQLNRCLQDPHLQTLKELVDRLDSEDYRAKVTPKFASKQMKLVKESLCVSEVTFSHCFTIFAAVADSAEFYRFVQEERFYGEKGQTIFHQQYQLITNELQHEDYDESVLNHLPAAFKVITPFLDRNQTFHQLMTQVSSLDTVPIRLETVNMNITLIRRWFSRAEGDTLQNIAKELDKVISTGHYTFELPDDYDILLGLPVQSSSLEHMGDMDAILTANTESVIEQGMELKLEASKVIWTSEQIGDFVRKLGFIDTGKEGGKQIADFKHISEIAYKLLGLYCQLKKLGTFQYFQSSVQSLPCSIMKEKADHRVLETELALSRWKKRVTELRAQYDWLLFFSIPKILNLYKLLISSDLNIQLDFIIHEISFLCQNDVHTREDLKHRVQSNVRECLKDIGDIEGDIPHMHVVGRFLALIFNNHHLPKRSDLINGPHRVTCLNLSNEYNHFLHYCPGYSQRQLIPVIIGICSGVPEAFEVLHCCRMTTEEELALFFKRVDKHALHSLVLGVNKLPLRVQEQLLRLDAPIQRVMQEQAEHTQEPLSFTKRSSPSTHFIETAPSVLRHVPWIQCVEHKHPPLTFEEAGDVCSQVVFPQDFACIRMVCGAPGEGKTHYIKEQLNGSPAHVTIAVNEAFTPLKTILRLRTLPLDKHGVAIFLNFTMLPPVTGPGGSVDKREFKRHQELIEVIGWFFFDLLILGYVEDHVTGKSFRIPGGLEWAIYIEIPNWERNLTPDEALKQFCTVIPALGLLGTPHHISPEEPYTIDDEVQLVCKYLQALKIGGTKGIDRLYKEGRKLVKFSLEENLSPDICRSLLREYMPPHVLGTKLTQRLFVKYMKRRCEFLDNLPSFNYNLGNGEFTEDENRTRFATDTMNLGSTLMNAMLKEVSDFCDADIKENWSSKPHQQIIYDYKDKGGSLGLISLHPHKLPESDRRAFEQIGVRMPVITELYSRTYLDKLLSRALNLQLEDGRLTEIDKSAYVLTLDYTIKMLNIHEGFMCGVPVIIEGETGVGKTALIEMLSKLWNQSFSLEWKKERERLVEFMEQKLKQVPSDNSDHYQMSDQAVLDSAEEYVNEETLLHLCQLFVGKDLKLHNVLQKQLTIVMENPVMILLSLNDSVHNSDNLSLTQLFDEANIKDTPEATARLLHALLTAQLKPTFHKINVHAALTPLAIQRLLNPVFNQAREFIEGYKNIKKTLSRENRDVQEEKQHSSRNESNKIFDRIRRLIPRSGQAVSDSKEENLDANHSSHRIPPVTLFLDEVNTSSCMGLFKEIIVDRTFDGTPIPENIFIVAACNPHRGNSMAALSNVKWIRGSYNVRQLHPTLRLLMWDYGSLDEYQESEYVNAKITMLPSPIHKLAILPELIEESQKRMRTYAYNELLKTNNEEFAKKSSQSCVSQRDIQRVFTFYEWFRKVHDKMKPHGEVDYSRRAALVALGIVYYLRLDNVYRTQYAKFLDCFSLFSDVSFTVAFEQEINWYIDQIELPSGIARTRALKENIFTTIVCTATRTPLIIVGAPGSSKTLSFNQTIANIKGAESRVKHFRDTAIFCSLDPYHYQCSRRTTSNEIQTVFSRAINRQRSHEYFKLPVHCVVFMDEAGLPEESHESLKVLHYHLDKQEVSFVAITNHVLDAAKTNRAVSLFRPEPSNEDLCTIAKGCLCSNPENPQPELLIDLDRVVTFCARYSSLMENISFARFFGLRDFVQFVSYLRRKRDDSQILSPQIVMHSLERNFNGSEDFGEICSKFLEPDLQKVRQRGTLDILRDSLEDHPQDKQVLSENEVRYKLVIDPSEDGSLVRLLFSFGILKRDKTRIFVCSNFPGDGELEKINTIAAIRHSAVAGHTVLLNQTDSIHESFYDLFNQRFRQIDDPEGGPRYYTNIAIGAYSKPSRVNVNFQCVVVLKKSEVDKTPAPFLNRFEKYRISYSILLETALEHLPPNMRSIVQAAITKAQDFVSCISGPDSLFGFSQDTLRSLILTLLPSVDHAFQELKAVCFVENPKDIKFYMLQEVVHSLRNASNFHIPECQKEEFNLDVESVFEVILQDPKFKGLMKNLEHEEVTRAIPEAINALYSENGGLVDISSEGHLVIALLKQWLVRHICKRLMQLMTPEAFILRRTIIPFSYMKNYLNFHAHFSLKNLVDKYYQAAEFTRKFKDIPTSRSPNKILCFTRSSPLINQLPNEYPSCSLGALTSRSEEILKDIVFAKTDKLWIRRISSILSQSMLQDLLNNFVVSTTAEVCLLVVNTQETSKEVINHVRIMIEETETTALKLETKVFVLLLHFPPAQFFQPCYPSLFLQGWDHCYLDTIAHSAVKGVVDIRDWFWQCCFLQQSTEHVDTLLPTLEDMLPKAIPILASRVFFGLNQNGSFNSPMNGHQRSQVLMELFIKQGQTITTVGMVLCKKFRTYWRPSAMKEQLEKAAMFSKTRESTLNITESIQANLKSLFFDFLVFMISKVNENLNIDVIFNCDYTPAIVELFIQILDILPTPDLTQVQLLSHHLPRPIPLISIPGFPFFKTVCNTFDRIVDISVKEANAKLDILGEGPSAVQERSARFNFSPHDVLTNLQEATLSTLTDKMEGCSRGIVAVVTKAIESNPDIWDRYFNEFVLYKLKLNSEESSEDVAHLILHTFLRQLNDLDAKSRIITLHSYLQVHQLDLAKLARVLRPLNMLRKLHRVDQEQMGLLHAKAQLDESPLQELLTNIKPAQHPLEAPEHLVRFVVTSLFDYLGRCVFPSGKSLPNAYLNTKMTIWFKVYRDVMTVPVLKQYVYSTLGTSSDDMTTVKAKLNLLQTIFLVIQTHPDLNDHVLHEGWKVFSTLSKNHFDTSWRIKTGCPRLDSVARVAVEVVSSTVVTFTNEDKQAIRIIIEGLFTHFFPPKQDYHLDDVVWFLELANAQKDWQNPQFDNVSSAHSEATERTKINVPYGVITMNVFKLYLSRMLCQRNQGSSTATVHSCPLLSLHLPTRSEVTNVLSTNPDLGSPCLYIPKFYRDDLSGTLGSSDCMQQPLAHLYFLTILEYLNDLSETYPFPDLVQTATSMFDACSAANTSPKEKLILYIELQAVIQVIAKHLAKFLDPSEPAKIAKIYISRDAVNMLMDDESTGGGNNGGHGIAVAHHIKMLLSSPFEFTDTFLKKYDAVFRGSGINCLEAFVEQLKVHGKADTLRRMELCYPRFPSEVDFVDHILSQSDQEQFQAGGELDVVLMFCQEWKQIQAGGLLLPDLVEFYQWLHTQLAYRVTYERASNLTISKVIYLAAERYGKPMGDHYRSLYNRVERGYNKYVNMMDRPDIKILLDTPLLHFLSVVEEEEEEYDCLYTVMVDIVTAHNMFIESIHTRIHARTLSTVSGLLTDQPTNVLLTEVNNHDCLFGDFTRNNGVSSLLQAIRSRYQPPKMSSTELPHFQLEHLEEDLVRMFVVGKPFIETPSSIRTIFKFKQSQKSMDNITDDIVCSTLDIGEINSRLPDEFKIALTSNLIKQFEFEFHSASHNIMMEIVTLLRTVCGHLIKVNMEKARVDGRDMSTLTLSEFMTGYVYDHLTEPNKVLAEIGITLKSFKPSQLVCLNKLTLRYMFNCLQQFGKWINEGFYDFSNLPFALKMHLTETDMQFLQHKSIKVKFEGNLDDLAKEVIQLIAVLKHSENSIIRRLSEDASAKPIIEYLEELHMFGKDDKLPPLIPQSILLQHYVHFRLALTRLKLTCAENRKTVWEETTQLKQWSEFIVDPDDASLLQETYEESESSNDFGNVSDCESEDDFTNKLMNDKEDDLEIVVDSPTPKRIREMEIGPSVAVRGNTSAGGDNSQVNHERNVLVKCGAKVIYGLSQKPKEFAVVLHGQGFISTDMFQEVVELSVTRDDNAIKLYTAVLKVVEHYPHKYKEFISMLQDDRILYGDLLSVLGKEYDKNDSSSQQQASFSLTPFPTSIAHDSTAGEQSPISFTPFPTPPASKPHDTGNRCTKAGRLQNDPDSFRATPNTIVTIDFGTTWCSVAYQTGVDQHDAVLSRGDPVFLELDDQGHKRVPNCILFDQFGDRDAFGYQARERNDSKPKALRPRCAYFERVKKNLQQEGNIDRNLKIQAMNGQTYFIVEVIAHILCYLKEKVLRDLEFRSIKFSDVDWVITVPAIWHTRGKKMMREAGYKAGLCSSDVHLKNLEVAQGHQSPVTNEAHPEKLYLALESESAAIQCLQEENMLLSDATQNYLIVDCGGGTVDIATHATIGGRIHELASSVGNFKGGTTVNEEFKSFLAEFVDDPDFREYLGTLNDAEKSHRKASINTLIYTNFEAQKLSFVAEEESKSFLVKFPWPFAKKFAEKLEEKGMSLNNSDVQIEEEGSQMRLSPRKMAEFFKPSIDCIGSLIINHLHNVNIVDTVFWVGGFGGCQYLRSELESRLKAEFPSKNYNFITPLKPQLAVIRGATAFRCEPEVIQQRKSDATYGIDCRVPFREDIHRPEYCEDDEEIAGKKWCGNIFSTFVQKNESIWTNEVFVADLVPTRCLKNNVCFTIYCAPRQDVMYTDEDGITELASIDLNIAGYDRNRAIEIVVDTTHTEIQVCVRDKQTNKEVKAVVDFLT